MALRNPNLTVYTIPYSENIYEVETRTVMPVGDQTTVNVDIFLNVYPDLEKSFQFKHDPIFYTLKGLVNSSTQLTESLYESQLKIQHSGSMLDGTLLNDFITI